MQWSTQAVSYPILFYPILSYPILSYPILSYPILSYSILSYQGDTTLPNPTACRPLPLRSARSQPPRGKVKSHRSCSMRSKK
jgi:hypothetical protein